MVKKAYSGHHDCMRSLPVIMLRTAAEVPVFCVSICRARLRRTRHLPTVQGRPGVRDSSGPNVKVVIYSPDLQVDACAGGGRHLSGAVSRTSHPDQTSNIGGSIGTVQTTRAWSAQQHSSQATHPPSSVRPGTNKLQVRYVTSRWLE